MDFGNRRSGSSEITENQIGTYGTGAQMPGMMSNPGCTALYDGPESAG